MLTLCALSISRMGSFVPICCLDGKVSSFSTCRKIITAIWLYSLVLSLPPVFGWGSYVPELSGLGQEQIYLQKLQFVYNWVTSYTKIYIYSLFTVRCTPDWHTENKSISYVLWILIVGFVIPASITVITSFVTCFQIYRVSFKVFPCAGHLLLYFIYVIYYLY